MKIKPVNIQWPKILLWEHKKRNVLQRKKIENIYCDSGEGDAHTTHMKTT